MVKIDQLGRLSGAYQGEPEKARPTSRSAAFSLDLPGEKAFKMISDFKVGSEP